MKKLKLEIRLDYIDVVVELVRRRTYLFTASKLMKSLK
jgi:hypothetical protein